MRLAILEFTQHEVGEDKPYPYVECRLIDPPIEFAVGYGVNLSEAFADMQARVLSTAVYSAGLLYSDPDEWKRQSEQQPDRQQSESENGSERSDESSEAGSGADR